jgi:hypothetical protein
MDEWEFNNASRARAVSFALTHPWDELRLLGRRIFILLFEVRRNPLYRGETQFASPVYWLGTFCMVVIRLAFFGCLWAGIRAVRQHLRQSSEATRGHFRNTIIYFSMTAAYAFPYLVGFVYERHLMPLVIPTVIYFVSSGYRKIRSSLVIS